MLRKVTSKRTFIVVCPQLRRTRNSSCSGHCYSGSVRYFSPLGTTCVITCTGHHDNGPPAPSGHKYNFTCVWENDVIAGGKAAWKPENLPDGITTGDFRYYQERNHRRPGNRCPQICALFPPPKKKNLTNTILAAIIYVMHSNVSSCLNNNCPPPKCSSPDKCELATCLCITPK